METFEEILSNNLTIFSLPVLYDDYMEQIKVYGFIFSPWGPADSKFGTAYLQRKRGEVDENELKRIIKVPSDSNSTEQVAMLSMEYYADAISKCGRDVFADTLSNVNILRSKMLARNVEDGQIAKSKVSFGQIYQDWIITDFQTSAETYATRRFGLIQSGLIQVWNEWKYRLESWNDTVETAKQISESVKPISIRDNIIVVFYVDLSFKGFCVIMFLCECIKYLHISYSCITISVYLGFCKLYFGYWVRLRNRIHQGCRACATRQL